MFLSLILNLGCTQRTGKENDSISINTPSGGLIVFDGNPNNIYESQKHNFSNDTSAIIYSYAMQFGIERKIDSCIYFLRQALSLEPRNKLILKDIAIAFDYSNDKDSCRKYLDKCLEVDSTYALALNSYGVLHRSNSNFNEAIEYFDKAIKYEPENNTFHFNKANTYRQIDQMDSCCKYLFEARNINTTVSDSLIDRLIILFDCYPTID